MAHSFTVSPDIFGPGGSATVIVNFDTTPVVASAELVAATTPGTVVASSEPITFNPAMPTVGLVGEATDYHVRIAPPLAIARVGTEPRRFVVTKP